MENITNNENEETKDFEIVTRDIPIILSAPHCVRQLRNGMIQAKESFTDTFAITISEKENINCIYKTIFLNDDANADKDSSYKLALKEFVESNNIKYLIDLHTMSAKRLPDVCISINSGKNIKNNYDLLQQLINAFNNNGISSVTVDEPFKASDPNCISNYISTTCGIPCFHIELNKKFANPLNFIFKPTFNKQAVENALTEVVKVLKNNLS